MHDNDTVAHPNHFRQFGRNHDNTFALGSQFTHQLINFSFRTHIDAACRLIKDQNIRFGHQPAGKQNFLLVAAGKIHDFLLQARRLNFDCLNIFGTGFIDCLLVHQTELCQIFVIVRDSNVGIDGKQRENTGTAAVFRQEGDTHVDSFARVMNFNRFPVQVNLAFCMRTNTEDGFHNFRASCTYQTRKAENLTLAYFK